MGVSSELNWNKGDKTMLTAKQKQVLAHLAQEIEKGGIAPSYDEMKEAVGLKSKSGIHRLILALEERGFIRRLPNRARAIEILRLPPDLMAEKARKVFAPQVIQGGAANPVTSVAADALSIPLLGKIAAGTPIEALEDWSNHIDFPADLVGRGDHFALEVEGDSMIEMGILEGDRILIRKGDTAQNGQIVVALIDGEEATLKTIQHRGGMIELMPANRHYKTLILEAERVQIQGQLVALLRHY